MKAVCLASSSAGNCYVITLRNGSRDSSIMVECGIPPREILGKLTEAGVPASSLEACLITHYHGDHSKAAKDVAKWGLPIYASKETLEHCAVQGRELAPLAPISIAKGVGVLPFPVKHDAEGSMGFVIKTQDECVVFVNDCKTWEANLTAFRPDYVFIECNYWEKQLYAQIGDMRRRLSENGVPDHETRELRSKISQFERNVNAHMSLAGCIRALKKLDLSRCAAIFLMHLSDANANEYVMKETIQNEFKIKTFVCKKKFGIK